MSRIVLFVVVLSVAVSPGLAQAGACMAFFDQGQFRDFNKGQGKSLDGIETFEESNIPPQGKIPLPAPLDQNPNTFAGLGFPNGLTQQHIAIWDNVTQGPNPPGLNPSGNMFALYVVGVGFLDAKSNKVGSDLFLFDIQASLDLVFGNSSGVTPRYTGVGFELSWFRGYGGGDWDVSIYNGQGATIGEFQFQEEQDPEPQTTFFGVWCGEGIGRINIYDNAGPVPDAIVNIEMWL